MCMYIIRHIYLIPYNDLVYGATFQIPKKEDATKKKRYTRVMNRSG